MNFQSRIFVDKLGLDPHEPRALVLCPLHNDSKGASLSVDLDKALWYCHGACDAPKGGGPIQFLMRWSKRYGPTALTKDEARREINRIFKLPDAATVAREHTRLDVLACMRWSVPVAIGMLRALDVEALWLSLANRDDDATWTALARIAAARSYLEWLLASFEGLRVTPAALAVYQELIARHLWTPVDRHAFNVGLGVSRRRRRDEDLNTYLHEGLVYAQAGAACASETQKGEACREDVVHDRKPSPLKRMPVKPTRTPVK